MTRRTQAQGTPPEPASKAAGADGARHTRTLGGLPGQGIGRRLIAKTHAAAGEETTLILVAAPGANDAYRQIGLQPFAGCCGVRRTR